MDNALKALALAYHVDVPVERIQFGSLASSNGALLWDVYDTVTKDHYCVSEGETGEMVTLSEYTEDEVDYEDGEFV